MAGIMKVEYDDIEMRQLVKNMRVIFPKLQYNTMAYIGQSAKRILKKKLLMGQELNLKGGINATDVLGRRMITKYVARNKQSVKISSYPVNLFENGRTLRDGKKEPGKKIITKKLKGLLNPAMQTIIKRVDKKIFQDEFDKI